MIVYDFDGTIYDGDSTVDFYKFCCKRHPGCLIVLPRVLVAAILWKTSVFKKDDFKENFYRFLLHIPDVDTEVDEFWKTHRCKVKQWYLDQKQSTDLIISASPEFTLKRFLEELGVQSICSLVDKKTGKLLGPNNSGSRKIDRYKELYGDEPIIEFYSDSHNDDPMAATAKKAYWVKSNHISDWPVSRH